MGKGHSRLTLFLTYEQGSQGCGTAIGGVGGSYDVYVVPAGPSYTSFRTTVASLLNPISNRGNGINDRSDIDGCDGG
jgi:hypothetical protein